MIEIEPEREHQRDMVLKELNTWLRTPYHHMGRIKGQGVDCAQLIWVVYYNCGLTPFMPLDYYPPDFMMHKDIERYMNIVLNRAREIKESEAKPADVVLYRIGRVFAHGGLITELGWPHIIHSYVNVGVTEAIGNQGNHAREKGGKERLRRFFTRW